MSLLKQWLTEPNKEMHKLQQNCKYDFLLDFSLLKQLPFFIMMSPSKHSSKLYCLMQGIMVV